MNFIFWIKIYNTIYIFWSYSNQKVTFWFIMLLPVLLVHGTTGKCGFESHFLHLFFIEIYLIIFNSDDIVMTEYMYTMYVYSVNVSWTIAYSFIRSYLSFTYLWISPVEQWFRNPDQAGVSACRALTDCATAGSLQHTILVVHIWAY